MTLITFMQYTFLASIIFDVAVGIWFLLNSKNFNSTIIRAYLVNLFFSIGWEVVLYISFFIQGDAWYNFIFNASTFSFGIVGMFTTYYLLWLFFDKQYISKYFTIGFTLLSGCFAVLSYIPGLVVGNKIYDTTTQLFYLENAPVTAPLYFAAILELIAVMSLLVLGYRHSNGRIKTQTRLLVVAFGTTTVVAVLTHVVIPLVVKSSTNPSSHFAVMAIVLPQLIGGICVSFISATIAYAILRYRIFSIRSQLRRYFVVTTIFFLLLLFVEGSLYSILARSGVDQHWSVFVLAASFILLFLPIQRGSSILVHRILPHAIMDLYALTDDEQKVIDSIPSLDRFVRLSVDYFMRCLPVEDLSLYLFQPSTGYFISAYPTTKQEIAGSADWIKQWSFGHYKDSLLPKKYLHSEHAIPVFHNDVLVAILSFNNRIDQKPLNQQDQLFVKKFSQFVALNLWNYIVLRSSI